MSKHPICGKPFTMVDVNGKKVRYICHRPPGHSGKHGPG